MNPDAAVFTSTYEPPAKLLTDEFLIRPLVVADNPLDYAAVMDSREHLRLWEGSTWPEDDFTLEANLADMQKMQQRHNRGDTYGYTVMNPPQTECLGCLYIAPAVFRWFNDLDIRPLGDQQWTDFDVVIQFWIRTSRLADQLDRRVVDAVSNWFTNDWQMPNHLFVTREAFEQQAAMFAASNLPQKFELADPESGDRSVAFG